MQGGWCKVGGQWGTVSVEASPACSAAVQHGQHGQLQLEGPHLSAIVDTTSAPKPLVTGASWLTSSLGRMQGRTGRSGGVSTEHRRQVGTSESMATPAAAPCSDARCSTGAATQPLMATPLPPRHSLARPSPRIAMLCLAAATAAALDPHLTGISHHPPSRLVHAGLHSVGVPGQQRAQVDHLTADAIPLSHLPGLQTRCMGREGHRRGLAAAATRRRTQPSVPAPALALAGPSTAAASPRLPQPRPLISLHPSPTHRQLQHPHLLAPAHQRDVLALLQRRQRAAARDNSTVVGRRRVPPHPSAGADPATSTL
mgnify:CR=1 FL=1